MSAKWWAGVLVVSVFAAGCAGLEGATERLKEQVQRIDLGESLDGLTDCGALADTFVGLVKDTVDSVDEIAASEGVAPPISDLREMVDELSVSRYYDIVERLGCARIQAQLDLIDKLREIDATTASGDDLLEEMVDAAQEP